jgi:hypothetical protein
MTHAIFNSPKLPLPRFSHLAKNRSVLLFRSRRRFTRIFARD